MSITPPVWLDSVRADCAVPAGWVARPLETRDKSIHQFWVSPSGATAYGVIVVRHLLLPLATDEMLLNEFLKEMKQTEGVAELIDQRRDATLAGGVGGLRFEALGSRYHLRSWLVSSGTRVWIVYAGTVIAMSVRPDELAEAEAARDATRVEPDRRRLR